MRFLSIVTFWGIVLCSSCHPGAKECFDVTSELPLDVLSSGVYRAYTEPSDSAFASSVKGENPAYTPFYISTYNRHGSRYQPNDKRYANTLRRLQEGHERGVLTEAGEALLPQIQVLCDSCLGHGGQLTSIGELQLRGMGVRLAKRYPRVFANHRFVSARASVVPRCGASMRSFMKGLDESLGFESNHLMEIDSAYMSYIAYDSPAMRRLSAKDAFWRADFERFYQLHTLQKSVVDRFFTDATGLDSLDFIDDLYWLNIGMQNVRVPGCDLSGTMTAEELFDCYRCVNYRMYICNSLSPTGQGIPALSASSLLQNIVESADAAIACDTVAATLRFGHDSNLLRLMALMRIKGSTADIVDPTEAWMVWQEAKLCPMGANLQLVFSRNAEEDVFVQFFHNEQLTSIDASELKPSGGGYYAWKDVRNYFLSKIEKDIQSTDFVEPVQ